MELTIHIKIAFTRKELLPFIISVSDPEAIFLVIKKKLNDCGLLEIAEDKFYTYGNIRLNKENVIESISDNTLFVLYNNIIPPYGACEYDREDGMVFFFHTSENTHRKFPHIHVWYSGEEISIYFKTLNVKGTFSNKKLINRAMDYVEKNKNNLLKKWNEIMQV